MITFRQVEILAAVIEHGSFRKCGQKLAISPVSVSEHMRALEAQLGVALFQRSKGGSVVVTEAGARAADAVPELLTHVYDFANFVAGDSARQGPIRIAMHGFMMRNLAGVVATFNESHDRRLSLISDEGSPEELQRRVASGDLDIAYFYAAEGADTFGQVVATEPLSIYVGEDHPLAQASEVSMAQLNATPIVSLAPDKPLRRVVDQTLLQAGITQQQHIIETSEFGLILSSLHRNLGFTCMFESIQNEEKQAAGLVIIQSENELPALEVRRITRRTALRFKDVRDAIAAAENAF